MDMLQATSSTYNSQPAAAHCGVLNTTTTETKT